MEPPENAGGSWVKLWFPVLPTGGAYTPSIRKWVFAVQCWEEGGGGGQEGTYMEKLVMKAFLGSSIWKVTSCRVSALLTTRLVTTVWANRDETLESTVRL